MNAKKDRLNKIQNHKYTAEPNGLKRAAKYNYSCMDNKTIAAETGFAQRLTQLREMNRISAREMSLSLGQGPGYINNIENGHNFPSMAMFFEICEYLQISPYEFFRYTEPGENDFEKMYRALSPAAREQLAKFVEMIVNS